MNPAEARLQGRCEGICASLSILLATGENDLARDVARHVAALDDLIRYCGQNDDVVLAFLGSLNAERYR